MRGKVDETADLVPGLGALAGAEDVAAGLPLQLALTHRAVVVARTAGGVQDGVEAAAATTAAEPGYSIIQDVSQSANTPSDLNICTDYAMQTNLVLPPPAATLLPVELPDEADSCDPETPKFLLRPEPDDDDEDHDDCVLLISRLHQRVW